MKNKNVKYPCRNCVYFATCGDNTRTEPCNGRKTKSEKKKEEMKLVDFLRIAEYANINWAKSSFTNEEVKENAEIYYADFQHSKENDTISETIKSLCKNLAEDVREMPDLEEPKQWLYQITSELGLIDMDCHDYLETDEWLGDFLWNTQ